YIVDDTVCVNYFDLLLEPGKSTVLLLNCSENPEVFEKYYPGDCFKSEVWIGYTNKGTGNNYISKGLIEGSVEAVPITVTSSTSSSTTIYPTTTSSTTTTTSSTTSTTTPTSTSTSTSTTVTSTSSTSTTTTSSTTSTSTTSTSTTSTMPDCINILNKECVYDPDITAFKISVDTTCDCGQNATVNVDVYYNSTRYCHAFGRPCGDLGPGIPVSTSCNCKISGPPPTGGSCGSGFQSANHEFDFTNMSVAYAGTYVIELVSNLSDGTVLYSENTTVDCVMPECIVEISDESCVYDSGANKNRVSFSVECSGADNVNTSLSGASGGYAFGYSSCGGTMTLNTGATPPIYDGTNTIISTAYKDGVLCAMDTALVTCSGVAPTTTTTTPPSCSSYGNCNTCIASGCIWCDATVGSDACYSSTSCGSQCFGSCIWSSFQCPSTPASCSQACQQQGYSGGSCKFSCLYSETQVSYACSPSYYDCCCTGSGGSPSTCSQACQQQGYSGGSCKFSCSFFEDQISYTCSPSIYDCCCS
ncbi:MAG: hypothetical protein JW724_08205, partial [Candidatus Altiarchaeota archaeon]|nr:hypothetical protein [Candidatus Altiarchaeota archaeon]